MLLHTHMVNSGEDAADDVEVYVLHATPGEAQFLADALLKALETESESYSISLGAVDQLTPVSAPAPAPQSNGTGITKNGIIVP